MSAAPHPVAVDSLTRRGRSASPSALPAAALFSPAAPAPPERTRSRSPQPPPAAAAHSAAAGAMQQKARGALASDETQLWRRLRASAAIPTRDSVHR